MDIVRHVSRACLWLFSRCAVVDSYGKATFPAEMSAIVPAFHRLWGHVLPLQSSQQELPFSQLACDWLKSNMVDFSQA